MPHLLDQCLSKMQDEGDSGLLKVAERLLMPSNGGGRRIKLPARPNTGACGELVASPVKRCLPTMLRKA